MPEVIVDDFKEMAFSVPNRTDAQRLQQSASNLHGLKTDEPSTLRAEVGTKSYA